MGNQNSSGPSVKPVVKTSCAASLLPVARSSAQTQEDELRQFLLLEDIRRSTTNALDEDVDDVSLEVGNLADDDDDESLKDEASEMSSETTTTSDSAATPRKRSKILKVFSSAALHNPKLIGEGGFGKVLEGNLQGKQVAIKIFHAPLGMQVAKRHIGPLLGLKHRNLVIIKGILATHNLQNPSSDCPQVLLDYFPEGNLLQYLSRKENPQDYLPPLQAMLGKLALDIIHGCEYLHSKKVIHGNLAARNILIQKALSKQKTHFNAKVGDYGIFQLAQGSGGNYYTLPSTKKVVPIRWVPKELVMDDDSDTGFTEASDVWSFGVVLWEMWTKGATPYGVPSSNVQVQGYLKSGRSPLSVSGEIKGCPKHIVAVMESIFKVNPTQRPKFSMLKEAFTEFKSKSKASKAKAQEQAELANKNKEQQQTDAKKKEEVENISSKSNGGRKGSKPDSVSSSDKESKQQGGQQNSKTSSEKANLTADVNKKQFQPGSSVCSSKQPPKQGGGGGGRGSQYSRSHHGSWKPGNRHHGRSGFSVPGAPPPYTARPLPNHAACYGDQGQQMMMSMPPPPVVGMGLPNYHSSSGGNPNGGSSFDDEIKKHQDKIKMLEAQKASDEIQRKTAELTDAIQRAATIGVNSVASGGGQFNTTVTGPLPNGMHQPQMGMTRGFPMSSQSYDSQKHHHQHHRGGGRGGRGNGGGSNSRKGSSQK